MWVAVRFFLSLSTKPLKIRFSIIPALVAGVPSPFISTSTPFSKAPFPAISIDFIVESLLIDAKAKKQTIEAEKLIGDNIYKVLIYFDKLYNVMNEFIN